MPTRPINTGTFPQLGDLFGQASDVTESTLRLVILAYPDATGRNEKDPEEEFLRRQGFALLGANSFGPFIKTIARWRLPKCHHLKRGAFFGYTVYSSDNYMLWWG